MKVKVRDISDYATQWKSYMPRDITKAQVKEWTVAHNDVTMNGMLPVPKDVTYSAMYIGAKIKEEKLLPDDEKDDLLFELGRQSLGDAKNAWKRAMKKLEQLRKEHKGLK